MRLSASLTLLALAANGALAQLQITDSIAVSVISVLATAIPPESISKATADPSAFSAELESSISAGDIPSWYQALPSDVKSYLPQLYPASTPAETTSSAAESTPAPSSESTAQLTTPAPSVTGSPSSTTNGTLTVSSATLASTGGANSEAPTEEPTSSSSEAGAAMPTGAIGAGLFGAVGVLGLLAL